MSSRPQLRRQIGSTSSKQFQYPYLLFLVILADDRRSCVADDRRSCVADDRRGCVVEDRRSASPTIDEVASSKIDAVASPTIDAVASSKMQSSSRNGSDTSGYRRCALQLCTAPTVIISSVERVNYIKDGDVLAYHSCAVRLLGGQINRECAFTVATMFLLHSAVAGTEDYGCNRASISRHSCGG